MLNPLTFNSNSFTCNAPDGEINLLETKHKFCDYYIFKELLPK